MNIGYNKDFRRVNASSAISIYRFIMGHIWATKIYNSFICVHKEGVLILVDLLVDLIDLN